ncbi:MAG TPA: insulinase family protein [Planctomycetota bacterium]|nr:insulinase family protein [Planctomycetota bacterium]
MRPALLAAAIASLALPQGSAPRLDSYLGEPLPFDGADRRAARRVLASGAVAFLAPQSWSPWVEVRVAFRGGSFADPPGKEGLALLAGEALVAGGTASRAPDALEKDLARLGAALDASIGETDGTIVLRVSPDGLKPALAVLVDVLRNPAFEASELERAKRRLGARLAAREDSLPEIEERAWDRVLRGEHFTTRLPSPPSIAAIRPDDCRAFTSRFLFPRNLVLAARGAFDEAAALALFEEALAGWANRETPMPIPPEVEATPAPGVYLVDVGRAVATARVRVGFAGVRREHADRPILDPLLDYEGGDLLPSRVDRVLRVDRALSWRPTAAIASGDLYRGDFSISAPVLAADAVESARALIEELRRCGEERATADAIAWLRQSRREREATAFASGAARAARFARDEIVGAPAEAIAQDRARLETLAPDDLIRAARRHLDPAKAIILVVGDGAALSRALPAWESLGPVTRIAL